MTEINYQCIGCGATIQTKDPEGIGYLPKSALEKGLAKEAFYCQRCFRLRHYNELPDVHLDEEVFLDQLNQIADEKAYVIHVIDVFDIEGTLISGLSRFIGGQDYAVVANKVDLLPKSVKIPRLRQRIEESLFRQGFSPDETLLLSANRPDQLGELTQLIERQIRQHNIYIVGVTNVGKSTLINQLIQYYGGDKEVITTSDIPGTTLDQIQIPLTEDYSLIDTPGLIRKNQISYYLSREELAQVAPKKRMKPKVFQLNPQQTLFFAGLARVDFIEGEKTAFTLYTSADLYIHRTKLSQADDLYDKQVGALLSPPKGPNDLPAFVKRRVQLAAGEDLVLSGIGWLTVNQSVELDVHLPKGIGMVKRPSLI